MQKQSTKFPANPVYYSANDQTIWSYISFGSYPQTEVTGETLTPQIIGSLYDSDGNAWINGTKYRRISRDDTTDNEFWGRMSTSAISSGKRFDGESSRMTEKLYL